jgi:hypothetical protein
MVSRSSRVQLVVLSRLVLLLVIANAIAACSSPSDQAPHTDQAAQIATSERTNDVIIQAELQETPAASQNQDQSTDQTDNKDVQVPETNSGQDQNTSYGILTPEDWQSLPVIPEFSNRAREIYLSGVEAGNDPRVFAKVGDCQNVPSMFLSIFDYPGYYTLGEDYGYLQETIDWYHGSFSRESEAVRRGFNAASVVSPVWADPEACEQGETPLDCEIRINNPSVAIISLETWWSGNPDNYEKYVRLIIEGLLEHKILPIVATKADNLEGDHQINQILVRLAMEYQIPVWNFWRAVQPLPGNGLMEDRFHLTFDDNHFNDPEALNAAWPWRNLTALQVLDRVRTELAELSS